MTDEPLTVFGGRSVGTMLREAREMRDLTLDDAARVTRIGKNYLVALEDDAYHKLPSLAYVKGFLRVYAGYLGLSPDDVVSRYEEWQQAVTPGSEEVEVPPTPRQQRNLPVPNRWTIPLVLMVLVLIMAYIVREKDQGLPRQEQPRPAVVPPPPPPVQHMVSSSTATRLRSSAPGEPEPLAPAGGEQVRSSAGDGIVLRLKVNQDCLLNINIDGTLSQQYELKAGDLIEWKGERVFSLDLGNAGGVEAEFNGKLLPPFGEEGSPAHIVLRAEGADEQP